MHVSYSYVRNYYQPFFIYCFSNLFRFFMVSFFFFQLPSVLDNFISNVTTSLFRFQISIFSFQFSVFNFQFSKSERKLKLQLSVGGMFRFRPQIPSTGHSTMYQHRDQSRGCSWRGPNPSGSSPDPQK